MKLSTYAKKLGISYRTAWDMFRRSEIQGYRLPTGTIIITENEDVPPPQLQNKVVVYARVSSSENKSNLDAQAERLEQYATAKGYQIYKTVKEIGSGINDNRKKLNQILSDKNYSKIIVEHRDRLTRFGFNYLDTLLKQCGKEIEVVNLNDNGKEDLIEDFVSIITSFCARIYGHRRCRRKTERIIAELEQEND